MNTSDTDTRPAGRIRYAVARVAWSGIPNVMHHFGSMFTDPDGVPAPWPTDGMIFRAVDTPCIGWRGASTRTAAIATAPGSPAGTRTSGKADGGEPRPPPTAGRGGPQPCLVTRAWSVNTRRKRSCPVRPVCCSAQSCAVSCSSWGPDISPQSAVEQNASYVIPPSGACLIVCSMNRRTRVTTRPLDAGGFAPSGQRRSEPTRHRVCVRPQAPPLLRRTRRSLPPDSPRTASRPTAAQWVPWSIAWAHS